MGRFDGFHTEPFRLYSPQTGLSEPDWDRYPYYRMVPKDVRENLAFRKRLLRECWDPEVARDVYQMCARDILFWFNAFAWVYEPRGEVKELPFVTYDFQDGFIHEMRECLRYGRDLTLLKSRAVGATWMFMGVYVHEFIFSPMSTFLVASRKEQLVDAGRDPRTLMFKSDYIISKLPRWMAPEWERRKLHCGNKENGATLDGESTNEDIGRGDRRTGLALDEFASVPNGSAVIAATNSTAYSRLFTSTPKGSGDAFHELVLNPSGSLVSLHWSLHPVYNKGMYTAEPGRLRLWTDSGPPKGYPYIRDGRLRSPWYDFEERRLVLRQLAAQELDMGFASSDSQFFDAAVIGRHRKVYSRDPARRCRVDRAADGTPVLVEDVAGRLLLWQDALFGAPHGHFVVAADISAGTGSSNSVIVAANRETGEKVAEYADPTAMPHELADVACSLARIFAGKDGLAGAYMVWEANGPGRTFGTCVLEAGMRNIHWKKRDYFDTEKAYDETGIPGWWSTTETKLDLLREYFRALKDELYVNPSGQALNECEQYVYTKTGDVIHSSQKDVEDDPSNARNQHGDRVIADALAWLGVRMTRNRARAEAKKQAPPPGSLASRRERLRRADREERYTDGI